MKLAKLNSRHASLVLAAGLLAGAADATTYRYSFDGAAFDTFSYASTTTDQTLLPDHTLIGPFDTTMRVSGYVDLSSPLAADTSFQIIDTSASLLDARFSNGVFDFSSDNLSLILSTGNDGSITDWSLFAWGGPGADFWTASASATDGSAADYRIEYDYECGSPGCGFPNRLGVELDEGVETASAATDATGTWRQSILPGPGVAPLVPAPLPASALLLCIGLGLLPVLRRN